MVRKLYQPRWISALLFILIIIYSQPGFGRGRLIDQENLLANTRARGRVRVIVTFSVPELDKFQKASRAFKVPSRKFRHEKAKIIKARKADIALATAIQTAGSDLFQELGLAHQVEHIFETVPQAVLLAGHDDLLSLADSSRVLRVVEDLPCRPGASMAVDGPLPDRDPSSYGVNIINAPAAWGKGYDGAGWYVAVLDTGVRVSHEMFTGKDIVEGCFSTTVDGSASSLCPGGAAEAEGPGSAVPPDRYGHGTHVAGIAVGRQPGGDLKGVAPGADLVAIQVFSYIPSWDDVGSYFSDQIKGLEYVYSLLGTHAIASANMSLGGGSYSDYCDDDSRKPIIDQLRSAGVAVTISTGNSGYCFALGTPACISSAVAVGASDSNDDAYAGNNWHPVMQDIFAPGVTINSALATGDTDYGLKTGTSMAAPHVAGAWAVFRQAAPTVTVGKIEGIMEATGAPVESSCGTDPSSGPRLDVAAVVDVLRTPSSPDPNLSAIPLADAGPDQVVDEESTVTLDASGSRSNSGHGLTFAWACISGPAVGLSDADTVNPGFTAPAVGLENEQLVFQVTVTDDYNGLTDTDSVTITVNDQDRYKPPTADAGPDQSVDTGATVQIDGSASTSNSGSSEPLEYEWSQTRGVAVTLSAPDVAVPTFVAPQADGSTELGFELRVVDTYNDLAARDSVVVTVNHIDNNVEEGFLPAAANGGEICGVRTEGGDSELVYLMPVDPADLENQAGRPDILEFIFELEINCTPGATVEVTYQLPRAAPHDAEWYKYRDGEGWSVFPAVFNEDRTRVTITLTDGGDGDQDGLVNGIITDPSGLGYEQPDLSGSGGGCFVETSRQK